MGSKFLLEIFQKENSLLILFFSINDEKKLKLISRLIESIFNNDIQFLVRRELDNGNLKLPPAVIHQTVNRSFPTRFSLSLLTRIEKKLYAPCNFHDEVTIKHDKKRRRRRRGSIIDTSKWIVEVRVSFSSWGELFLFFSLFFLYVLQISRHESKKGGTPSDIRFPSAVFNHPLDRLIGRLYPGEITLDTNWTSPFDSPREKKIATLSLTFRRG